MTRIKFITPVGTFEDDYEDRVPDALQEIQDTLSSPKVYWVATRPDGRVFVLPNALITSSLIEVIPDEEPPPEIEAP